MTTESPILTIYRLTLDNEQVLIQAPNPETAIAFQALTTNYVSVWLMASVVAMDGKEKGSPATTPLAYLRNGYSQVQVMDVLEPLVSDFVYCSQMYPCSMCKERFSHFAEVFFCEPCRVHSNIRDRFRNPVVLPVGSKVRAWYADTAPFVYHIRMIPQANYERWDINWAWSFGGMCGEGVETLNGDEQTALKLFAHHAAQLIDKASHADDAHRPTTS